MTRVRGRLGRCGRMPGGGGGGTQPDSAAAGSIVFAFRCDSPAPMPDIIRVSFGGFDLHKLFAWPGFAFFYIHFLREAVVQCGRRSGKNCQF